MKTKHFKSLTWFIVLLAMLGAGCQGQPAPFTQVNFPTDIPAPAISVSADGEVELPVRSGEWTRGKVYGAEHALADTGIVFVTGVDGGEYQPVDGIYSRMGEKFAQRGAVSIFVQYRHPGVIGESVQDAMAAVQFLRQRGVKRIAVMGWSFGGAVIVHTATLAPEVVTIVGLAPQSLDTEPVALFKNQSILLIHSEDDENVPFWASEQILAEAPQNIRKELVPLRGHLHALETAIEEIDPRVETWLRRELQL